MRGDITAHAGSVTVSHFSTASKQHVCGSCGGPIGVFELYVREETVDASILHLQDGDPNFWRRWGRVPHASKEIGIFHRDDKSCEEWLRENSEDVVLETSLYVPKNEISDRRYQR